MANFQPSSLVSEIRGSVGQLTYSRNRGGAVVKQKLVQTNPDTALQQAVRAEMADAVIAWRNETQEVQDMWIQFASSKLIGKNISRKIHRSGMNEYTSRYLNKFVISGAVSPYQPLPSVRLFPVITLVAQSAGSILLSIETLAPVGDCTLVIYATPPISPGINAINKSFYRVIGLFEPVSTSFTLDVYSMINAYYSLTVGDSGKKVGIAIKAVNTDNYAAGQFFFVQTILSGLQQFNIQLFNDDYYNAQLQSFVKKANSEPSTINKTRSKLWLFYRY